MTSPHRAAPLNFSARKTSAASFSGKGWRKVFFKQGSFRWGLFTQGFFVFPAVSVLRGHHRTFQGLRNLSGFQVETNAEELTARVEMKFLVNSSCETNFPWKSSEASIVVKMCGGYDPHTREEGWSCYFMTSLHVVAWWFVARFHDENHQVTMRSRFVLRIVSQLQHSFSV